LCLSWRDDSSYAAFSPKKGERTTASMPRQAARIPLTPQRRRVAIDIHTQAEEPCGMHGDDGYDDFQERMADYFKSPHKHPPTVPLLRHRQCT
jgi:hypothetical protein